MIDTPAPRIRARRSLARLAVIALVAAGVSAPALGGGEAAAFRGWCRADPEVQIAGQTAHVQLDLDVPNMHVAQAMGVGKPIAIVLTVPRGVDARLLAVDSGFGQGYDFTFQQSAKLKSTGGVIPVQVDALIPMQSDGLAVRVAFVPAGSDAEQAASELQGQGNGVGQPDPDRLTFASSPGTANDWVSVLAAR